MKYLSTKKTAQRWGISQRRVNEYCNEGRIKGVKRLDWMWMIPYNAEKPTDRRKKINRNNKIQNYKSFEKKIFEYEKQIKEDTRKNNGIFYTDLNMVELMYDNIKEYIDEESKILDPCCGAGSFLLGALKSGYKNIYGLDNDADAIEISKNIIDSINTLDTLSNTGHETLKSINIDQPDLIIGNPPYAPIREKVSLNSETQFTRLVEKNGNNLFVAALYRALEMVKDSGFISYIIPKNFLHVNSYKALRKQILKDYTIISIVDIGSHFKNVRGEQIVLTLAKEKTDEEHSIEFKKLTNSKFVNLTKVPQRYFKDQILIFDSKLDIQIFEKLTNRYKNLGQICTGYIGRGKSKSKDAISGRNIIKFGLKDVKYKIPATGNKIFIQNIYSSESGIIGTFAGDLEAKETVTIITDGDENICRYLLGILHSRLCNYYLVKYCFNNSKLTMHTDAKYIKKIPISMDVNNKYYSLIIDIVKRLEAEHYLSEEWLNIYCYLNETVYKIYNLYPNEINYIETYMKEIQSKRWFDKNGR